MKKANKQLADYLVGLLIFIAGIMVIIAIESKYMAANYVTKKLEDWLINTTLFLASFISGFITLKIIKEQYTKAAFINLSVNLVAIFVGSTLINEAYNNVLARTGAIIFGCVLSYIVISKNKRGRKFRKRRNR